MKNGFTLIELMIVIVIVGILAAVGIPAYQNRNNPRPVTPVVRHPADNTTCIGGVAHHLGAAVIVNGNTVRC